MQDNKAYKMMANLNHPMRFVGITLDEAVIAGILSIFLILSTHKIAIILIALATVSSLRKFKKNNGPKYLIVLFYRYFPAMITRFFLPKMPDSSKRFWRH